MPANSDRSSSTCCTNRDRLATTSTRSSWWRRTYAITLPFAGRRKSIVPRPIDAYCFRRAISRFIHHSSDDGLFCCASTFSAS